MIGINLGCGAKKKEGFIGVDFVEAPNVDFFLNMEKESLPFEDYSIDYVFSSHFLEHIENHLFVLVKLVEFVKMEQK
jgi:predicted SAM-dependent methyltransferase